MRYIETKGFDATLSRAMRAWAKTIHGGASAQSQRKEIEWLLWFDTEVPLDPKVCWSTVIQKDLRAMSSKNRTAWIALLRNVTFALVEAPTKKWLKPAPELLAAIDLEDFRARMIAWLACCRSGFTRCLSAAPTGLKGTSLKIYNQLCEREGRTPEIQEPPPPPPLDREEVIRKGMTMMLKRLNSMAGPGVEVGEETVEVTDPAGVRYTIDVLDGRILRHKDNKAVRLEIDFSRPPFRPFKQIFDNMDMMNPFKPNYARTMMLAQILSGQLEMDVPIVVDED